MICVIYSHLTRRKNCLRNNLEVVRVMSFLGQTSATMRSLVFIESLLTDLNLSTTVIGVSVLAGLKPRRNL